MPSLESRADNAFVKIMVIGNSGAGKTGSLTSLVRAGYRVRILDLDYGLDALINHIKSECPDKINLVDYMAFRDVYKNGPMGPTIVGAAKAFPSALKAMDKWEDGTSPAEWGPGSVFVLDTLTGLSKAAFAWAQSSNPSAKEPRQWYYSAQQAIEDTIAGLTSDTFGTNVIVMSHIDIVTQKDGTVQGFATAIGKSLGPKLPRYFNTLVALETAGQGSTVKRKFRTYPTAMLTLKNPAPMKIEAEYPIETGLATLFSKLSGKS
jgi:hypothetical protein